MDVRDIDMGLSTDFVPRNIADQINVALTDRPVVLLNGARQTGKSTLVQRICQHREIRYFTFDDITVLSAAKNDPEGFLSGIEGPVALDEVQRVPEIFPAIKAKVDRNRTPGRFLLTGSANVMSLPRLADYLVGRMEIISLHPFSAGEKAGKKEQFIDSLFSPKLPSYDDADFDRPHFFDHALMGGYPEVLQMASANRRAAWFQAYISTLLQRDVKDLSSIEGLSEMPRLLSLLAARSSHMLNMSEISRSLGIAQMTLKRYFSLLQAVFIAALLPAWSGNIGKRLIKAPKLFLNDTGLLGFLSGLTADRIRENPDLSGPLVENFVMQELSKQRGWSDIYVNLFYYRTAAGKEVDFVIESLDGALVGIEVKSASTIRPVDLKGLHDLAHGVGSRFLRGVILYLGTKTIPFAENIHALPVSSLWM
jgi:predicted AAA+ superfamily ATPase